MSQVLGVLEAARYLGVSRQRISNMVTEGILPSPDWRLACGPIWKVETIDSFLAGWSRKPGRPPKVKP